MLEKNPPTVAAPWWLPPKISIHETKEKARVHHEDYRQRYPDALMIYTDGRGIDGKIGAAALAPQEGRVKKVFLGNKHTSTVYAAELKGIYLALKIAQQELGDSQREVLIYTDNQAAITIAGKPRSRSGSYLLAEIIKLIDEIRPRTRHIEISWIPAHTGIEGNEAADLAAKEATGWRSNRREGARPSAPPRQLYSLKTTLTTWINQTSASEWATDWANETKGRKSYEYNPIPGIKALEPHRGAPKSLSSVITQLRTGKIGLNAYLHSRNVPGINSPNCGCGYRLQSIEHLLLHCRKYRQLRRDHLGPGYKTLGEVLSTPKLTLKAAEFMVATRLLGQFRSVWPAWTANGSTGMTVSESVTAGSLDYSECEFWDKIQAGVLELDAKVAENATSNAPSSVATSKLSPTSGNDGFRVSSGAGLGLTLLLSICMV
ncbi:hypothetical protein V491_07268 [Pseudogymnoascus sp. VKM F-3775]|nr:hypothetical protein V491_07268 [Pseudogymnoascus sp. VKM F-3775]